MVYHSTGSALLPLSDTLDRRDSETLSSSSHVNHDQSTIRRRCHLLYGFHGCFRTANELFAPILAQQSDRISLAVLVKTCY